MQRVVLLLVVMSTVMAGCVAPADEPICDGSAIDIEVLAPGPIEGIVHVRAGADVRIMAYVGECAAAEGYEWVLDALPGSGAGFSGERFQSASAEALLTLPYAGAYSLKVRLVDDDGDVLGVSKAFVPLFVYFVVDAILPKDGTTYEVDFKTFCCPVAHSFNVTGDGDEAVAPDWEKMILTDGARVVWRGTGNGSDAAPAYRDVLGDEWFEDLNVRVRPDGDVSTFLARNEYRVEIRIGPGWDQLYSV